jgi:purine-nucleoside phosphorylase
MYQNLQETTDFINKNTEGFEPEIGIILGTGLGALVGDIEVMYHLSYSEIPHFPISTLEFHSGRLIFGILSGKRVVAMQGRLHYYEGYDMKQITYPVRIMKMLGINKLFVSNASGALNPDFRKGDLMIIHDHINMQSDNPLRGKNLDKFGSRFPDMCEPYNQELISKGMEIAQKYNIRCHKGVYVSVNGPNLETRAEYRFLRIIGADAVGMSTVPEVIIANHMLLPVFAISVLTDEGFPDTLQPVSLEEILKVAEEAEPKMTTILKDLILEL